MRHRRPFQILALAVAGCLLAGCERGGPGAADADASVAKLAMPAPPAARAMMLQEAAAMAPVNRPADGTLAYAHDVSVELPAGSIAQRLRELQAACTPQGEHRCTLLDVTSNTSGEVPSASVRMRLAPTGVAPLVALAGKEGRVTQQSTHAEDLAEPIADTERQLALLTTHRDRLAKILENRNLGVDQLITVSRELSSTQTQIDQFANQRANLRRRVDTDLLSLQLVPPPQSWAEQRTPVLDALRGFGSTIADSAGDVIRFVAALLPWLVVLVPAFLLLRAGARRLLRRRGAQGATGNP